MGSGGSTTRPDAQADRAYTLGTAERTIKLHRHNVMQKLDIRSLAELALFNDGGRFLRRAQEGLFSRLGKFLASSRVGRSAAAGWESRGAFGARFPLYYSQHAP